MNQNRAKGNRRPDRFQGTSKSARFRRRIRKLAKLAGRSGANRMVPSKAAPGGFKTGDPRDPKRVARKPWKRVRR